MSTTTAPAAPTTPTTPDLREPLFAAQAWAATIVENVRMDQLDASTPCRDFDVRALLAHMSTVDTKIIGFATDHRDVLRDHDATPAEQAAAAEAWAVEHVDDRTLQEVACAIREKSASARTVWTDDVLDTPIQLGWGPILPGSIVTGIYVMEVLTHAWDLAMATGQPSEAPGGLGTIGLAAARASLPDDMPRGIAHGVPFGPKVVSAAGAGPTESMVNWTGRSSR